MKRRKSQIDNYNENGYQDQEKKYKAHKKELETVKPSRLLHLLIKIFPENVLDSIFFFHYFYCQKILLKGKKIPSPPAKFFEEVFRGIIVFKEIKQLKTISIFVIAGEIFVLDFGKITESLEHTYLVPFMWYRAFDKNTKELDYYESGVSTDSILICKLESLNTSSQLSHVKLLCFQKNIKFAFYVQNVSENGGRNYFCPFTEFKEGSPNIQNLTLLISSGGEYIIFLVWRDTGSNNFPLFSFKKRFHFSDPKMYRVPEYFFYDQDEIISPKNGSLPIGMYVDFIIKKSSFQRMFLVSFTIYEKKVELFLEGSIFKRQVQITDERIFLIGEREGDLKTVALAKFDGFDHSNSLFSKMDKTWFTFTRFYKIDVKPVVSQKTRDSHPLKLLDTLRKLFKSSQIENKILKLSSNPKKVKRPSDIVKLVTSFLDSTLTLECIFAIYTWIVNNIKTHDTEVIISHVANKAIVEYKDVLIDKIGDSKQIANLFKECLKLIGVKAIMVDGFIREPGLFDSGKADVAWNLVKYKELYYIVDCFSVINDPYLLEEYQKVPFFQRKPYYFFQRPEVMLHTHFPEESCYSLLEDFEFDYSSFHEQPIISPYMEIHGIQLISNVRFNEELQEVFIVTFRSIEHTLVFSLGNKEEDQDLINEQKNSVEMFQKISYLEHEELFEYNLYFIKLEISGNFDVEIYLKTKNGISKKTTNVDPSELLNMIHSDSMPNLHNVRLTINPPNYKYFPIINFNLFLFGEIHYSKQREMFSYPKYLQTEPLNSKILRLQKTVADNSVPSLTNFDTEDYLRVLSPASYYIPSGTRIKFLIFFKIRMFPLFFSNAIGEVALIKINENVYEYVGAFHEGKVLLNNQTMNCQIEFKAEKILKPSIISNFIEYC